MKHDAGARSRGSGRWQLGGVAAAVGTALLLTPMGMQALAGESPPDPDVTAPVITLVTPPEMAGYITGQTVQAQYLCEDEAGGSGINTCLAQVADLSRSRWLGFVLDGGPIDTTQDGKFEISVTASDNAGNTSEVRHVFTISRAPTRTR